MKRNIYIDCGFYIGNALQTYLDTSIVDETWDIYAFEVSPDLDMMQIMDKFPMSIHWIPKAVWIKDGEIDFMVSKRENASFITGTSYSGADKEKITVSSIDFSKFLADLPEAYIICSMDIEGAEFQVLEKCIKDGTASKINLLDIEFHHRFMADYTRDESIAICKQLKDLGVQVRIKEAFQ